MVSCATSSEGVVSTYAFITPKSSPAPMKHTTINASTMSLSDVNRTASAKELGLSLSLSSGRVPRAPLCARNRLQSPPEKTDCSLPCRLHLGGVRCFRQTRARKNVINRSYYSIRRARAWRLPQKVHTFRRNELCHRVRARALPGGVNCPSDCPLYRGSAFDSWAGSSAKAVQRFSVKN